MARKIRSNRTRGGATGQDPARGGRRLRWWILLAVVVVAGLHIAFWGWPLPAHYAVHSVPAPGDPGTPREWRIERHRTAPHFWQVDPVEIWRARDTHGDGVIDQFETPQGNFVRPGLRAEPKRWLVICLDGVPLRLLQDLWDRGHFREFHRPTAVVSVFPSDSEAALTAVLRAEPPPGYEHLYFDRGNNKVRGGAWVTLTGSGIPYIAALDYDPPGWAKALPYLLPAKTYRADLGRLRKDFLASHQDVFLAHLSSSDSLMHLLPPRAAEPFLVEFESLVRELYLDTRGEMGVLIFSDHGNTLTPSRAAPLESFLEQSGWKLANSLAGPRDVAVPMYGLIGFIAVYCQDAAAEALARDLAALEGADLVVTRNPSGAGVAVQRAGGARAELRWNADGSRYWYDVTQGDPLELLPVWNRLRVSGQLGADGSAGDADVFAATLEARYPDAASRLRDWATDHVQNRANVLVSLQPGYFHGAGVFQHIVNFKGTHGALEAASSLGFAMATRTLPPAVRLSDLLPREFLHKRGPAADQPR
jgi:hypothetical protein